MCNVKFQLLNVPTRNEPSWFAISKDVDPSDYFEASTISISQNFLAIVVVGLKMAD